MKNVLFIVGSLKQNSFNRQLAEQAEALLQEQANVRYLSFSEVPFFNQDLEFPAPESVAKVRQAAQEADAIWIFSPEYNFQIPGVLKNLLDWLSRAADPNDHPRNSVVKGKAVTISSAAGKSAGTGVRKNLRALLDIMSMHVVGGEGTGVVLEEEAFRTGHLTLSPDQLGALKEQADQLLSAL